MGDVGAPWSTDKIAVEGIMRVAGVDGETAVAVWSALDPLIAHITRLDVAAARAEEREAALAEAAALAIGCEHSASLGWCDICGEWLAALTALPGGGA